MSERPDSESAESIEEPEDERDRLIEFVGEQEERKIRARREGDRGIWFGIGMYGLIGWSVAVPTLIGIAVGVWLDSHYPTSFSWTVTLLFAGLVIGCINAWYWLKREGRID